MQERTGSQPQLAKVPARKSPLTRMKRLARKADRSVRTLLRYVAVVAAIVAVVVYWNFGTFSPCGVLREAMRQRGDVVAIFPDGVIDFAFEARSAKCRQRVALPCCSKPLLRRCRPPASVPTVDATVRAPTMKAKVVASVPRLAPFAPCGWTRRADRLPSLRWSAQWTRRPPRPEILFCSIGRDSLRRCSAAGSVKRAADRCHRMTSRSRPTRRKSPIRL